MSARRLCGFLIVVVLLSLVGRGRISSGANVPDQRQQTASAVASHLQFPIIIDHTTSDLEQIPEYWIRQAKKDLRVAYGHTSHGSQPITGMAVLQADPSNGGLYDFVRGGETISGALSIADSTPSGDLGNPDRVTWEQRTRDYLNSTGSDRNVMIWSWCGQASSATEADIQTYLDLMSGLERDFPHVTFVYMTGHLDGSGVDGNLNQRNEQIRQHCRDNDRVLFDFADIESYDPDGAYFLDRGADDGCVYQGGNWAQEWCAANPSDALCTACSCAHSEPLNCNLKARAFWWMMARLAGWGGPTGDQADLTPSSKAVSSPFASYGQLVTYTVAIRSASGPVTTTVRATDSVPAGLLYLPGSLTASSGSVDDSSAPILQWSGVLTPTPVVTVTYATTVTLTSTGSVTLLLPRVITNTAVIQGSGDDPVTRTVTLRTDWLQVFLPLAARDQDSGGLSADDTTSERNARWALVANDVADPDFGSISHSLQRDFRHCYTQARRGPSNCRFLSGRMAAVIRLGARLAGTRRQLSPTSTVMVGWNVIERHVFALRAQRRGRYGAMEFSLLTLQVAESGLVSS